MRVYPDTETFIARFSPMRTGLKGRCPQCERTTLFRAPLKVKKSCEVCGLDYSFAGPADGPSFFAMTFMCFFAMIWTLVLRFVYDASIWTMVLTVVPLVIIGSAALLHYLRGWFVCAEYFIKIRDGRLVYKDPA